MYQLPWNAFLIISFILMMVFISFISMMVFWQNDKGDEYMKHLLAPTLLLVFLFPTLALSEEYLKRANREYMGSQC